MPIAKITASIDRLGWGDGILYLLGRAMQRVSGRRARIIRYIFVAQPVPQAPTAACPPSVRSPVRVVGSDDPLVAQFPRPPKVVARRYAAGTMCFAAETKERFAGFIWLAREGYDEDEVRCRYEFAEPARSAWDFDVYVRPEYRLGRTFARLWDAANTHLAEQGVAWSYSRISAFNAKSLASHSRLGIRELFRATFVCVGPVQLSIIGAPPYVHLSMSDRSRPVLRLRAPR